MLCVVSSRGKRRYWRGVTRGAATLPWINPLSQIVHSAGAGTEQKRVLHRCGMVVNQWYLKLFPDVYGSAVDKHKGRDSEKGWRGWKVKYFSGGGGGLGRLSYSNWLKHRVGFLVRGARERNDKNLGGRQAHGTSSTRLLVYHRTKKKSNARANAWDSLNWCSYWDTASCRQPLGVLCFHTSLGLGFSWCFINPSPHQRKQVSLGYQTWNCVCLESGARCRQQESAWMPSSTRFHQFPRNVLALRGLRCKPKLFLYPFSSPLSSG